MLLFFTVLLSSCSQNCLSVPATFWEPNSDCLVTDQLCIPPLPPKKKTQKIAISSLPELHSSIQQLSEITGLIVLDQMIRVPEAKFHLIVEII